MGRSALLPLRPGGTGAKHTAKAVSWPRRPCKTQGKGSVFATKAVGPRGKGGVFATKAVGPRGKGGDSQRRQQVHEAKAVSSPRRQSVHEAKAVTLPLDHRRALEFIAAVVDGVDTQKRLHLATRPGWVSALLLEKGTPPGPRTTVSKLAGWTWNTPPSSRCHSTPLYFGPAVEMAAWRHGKGSGKDRRVTEGQ